MVRQAPFLILFATMLDACYLSDLATAIVTHSTPWRESVQDSTNEMKAPRIQNAQWDLKATDLDVLLEVSPTQIKQRRNSLGTNRVHPVGRVQLRDHAHLP
jgi:hypothetical protein